MQLSRALIFGLLITSLACEGGDKKTRSNIAKAFENADPQAAAEQASEDMKRLKERTAAKAEAAVREAIEAATVVPPGAAGDLPGACKAMREAYDDFVQRRLAHDQPELDRWNIFKPMDLDKAESKCLEQRSVEAARCQEHAFANASREVTRSRAPDLLARCREKYGNQLGAAPTAAGASQPT